MKRFIFLFSLCAILALQMTSCGKGMPAKKKAEEARLKMEAEKRAEEQRKIDIFLGKVGSKTASAELAGKIFEDKKIKSDGESLKIKFDKDTNSCTLYFNFRSFIPYNLHAEYTMEGNKIIFDFTKHSTMMSKINDEDVLSFWKEIIYLESGKTKTRDEAWEEWLKLGYFEDYKQGFSFYKNMCTKLYSEYINGYSMLYEGVISGNKITINKLVYPDCDSEAIKKYENVEFVKKD
ncbi:hypothetical protein [Treponema pedis]|uniref:hypothetical protein n=1 Tax=Treponema pedis TaxID=409322 RepID=UPI003D1B29D5